MQEVIALPEVPPIPEDAPPFPDEALDDYLEPDFAPPPDTLPNVDAFERLRRFEPTDDVAAEKVMRRLVYAHRRRREIKAQAEELLDPIIRWRDESLAPWERRIAWLSDHLKLYAVKRRWLLGEKDPGAKTLKLPSGTVPTRRKDRTVDVMDEAAFLAWAEASGRLDLTRLPPPPARAAAKVKIKEAVMIVEKDGRLLAVIDGEEVPGLVALDIDVTADPAPDLSS